MQNQTNLIVILILLSCSVIASVNCDDLIKDTSVSGDGSQEYHLARNLVEEGNAFNKICVLVLVG